LKGIGHKFQGLDEPFKEWFESLRDGPQIDDKIVAHTNSLSEWFAELSLNQKIVVGLSTLILLAILWMIFAMLRRLRRWYRRKRIPKNINLHLDRDN
jgi:hypothetical protein